MRHCFFALLAVLALTLPAGAADRLIIHEWGTFTSLQDEQGRSLGGINADDEALPAFVHDLMNDTMLTNKGGVPVCFPSVTMRLETPVLYFHPAAGMSLPKVDVSAQFHGGLLTQFYPDATATPARVVNGPLNPITARTVGTLAWQGLSVGGDEAGPATDAHVWTAPRSAAAANVRAQGGESEKFLFYRGVGHVDAPMVAVREGNQIQIHGQIGFVMKHLVPLVSHATWLCELRPDGRCAWRALGPLDLNIASDHVLAKVSPFDEGDFSRDHMASLQTAMHSALVAEGLYDDEATAMLSTWEASYFKSAGTRLFFLVPRGWTDHYLPLHVSVDAEVQRVMMGRIDLVTPQARHLLRQIATGTGNANDCYSQLGRFRDALLLDELSRRPTDALAKFVAQRGLTPLPAAIQRSR